MSNYYGMVRTNYFHVKDEEQFQALMAKVICGDGSLELWDNMKDANGNQLFGFGVYGGISGIQNPSSLPAVRTLVFRCKRVVPILYSAAVVEGVNVACTYHILCFRRILQYNGF